MGEMGARAAREEEGGVVRVGKGGGGELMQEVRSEAVRLGPRAWLVLVA